MERLAGAPIVSAVPSSGMSANERKTPNAELISPAEVLRLRPGRWKSVGSLSASSRRKGGPAGRVTLGANRSAYRRDVFLAWLAADEARTSARLDEMRASAARAREILAAKRAARRAGGEA